MLNTREAQVCITFARHALQLAFSNGLEPISIDNLPNLLFEEINIGIYCSGRLRACKRGRGSSLRSAILDAVTKLLKSNRSGHAIGPADLENGRIELWLQYARIPISDPDEIDLGLDGVALEFRANVANFIPSTPLFFGIADATQLLESLARKASLDDDEWAYTGRRVYRTKWKHYVENESLAGECIELWRLRPARGQRVTFRAIQSAVELASKRLSTVQKAEGYYLYRAHPFRQIASSGIGNLIRQAGAALAMSRAADAMRNNLALSIELSRSALRVISFLLSTSIKTTDSKMFVVDAGSKWGWLGASALTLAALQADNLGLQHLNERKMLQKGIISLQREDGSFCCSSLRNPIDDDGQKQDYYPGEALMALARELRLGESLPSESIDRAFVWYREYFRRNHTTAFVSWHAEAWSTLSLYFLEGGQNEHRAKSFADFVFEMVDWILQFQITSTQLHEKDYLGSFENAGAIPGISTAGYSQAIIYAYVLARRFGLIHQERRYRMAARLGLSFLLRLQITPEMAFLFSNPSEVVGATTRTLSDLTLRCDFDQHAITAYLSALEAEALL
jgi:hypothetical protein